GNPAPGDDVLQRRRITYMRLQQFRADLISDIGHVSIRLQLCNLKDQLAGERIAVGVQSGRRQGDQSIPGLDALPGKKFFALDDANDETSEIVFARRIKSRHLRRLAADEGTAGFTAGTAHPFDKLFDDLGLEFAHRKIVEEKQRLGALDENVVYAVIYKVGADGGVHAHGLG